MTKTRIGLSVGIVAAALYFLGAFQIIPAFLLAGYVLLFEEDQWLKKSAVKMLAIVVTFGVFSLGINIVTQLFDGLRLIFGWIFPFAIQVPFRLDSLISLAITVIRNLLLILLGFNALTQGTIRIGFLDKIIDKHVGF